LQHYLLQQALSMKKRNLVRTALAVASVFAVVRSSLGQDGVLLTLCTIVHLQGAFQKYPAAAQQLAFA
jgi:hypothetical protein